jgi:hypothetical protein
LQLREECSSWCAGSISCVGIGDALERVVAYVQGEVARATKLVEEVLLEGLHAGVTQLKVKTGTADTLRKMQNFITFIQ